MRYLEVRRHAKRHKPNEHLAQVGVSHARKVGEGMGPFALVVSSTLARALETAIAMGFAVDRQMEWLSDYPDAAENELPYPATFATYANAAQKGGAVAAFCREQAQHWRSLVGQIPDGATALMTSHGGVIEMGAVGCVLADGVNADFAAWGDVLSYCEGVRLIFDGDRCVSGEVLRVPAK
jgi:broad specificity phosphatase PhoE